MVQGGDSIRRGGRLTIVLLVSLLFFIVAGLLSGACTAVPVGNDSSSGYPSSEDPGSPYFSTEYLTASFFYSEHCIACAKAMPIVDGLAVEYPSVTFVRYSVLNGTNNELLFFSFGKAYGNCYPRYPTVFLSDGSFFEGYGAISTDLPLHLAALEGAPVVTGDPVGTDMAAKELTPVPVPPVNISVSSASPPLPPVGLVITAGLIDGINPCAVAVLIFLLLALVGAGGRMRMLRFGAAYVAGVYLIYFISGFGLLAAVRVAGLSWYFSCAAGIIAVLLGVVMVADSFRQEGAAHFRISASGLASIRKVATRGGVISAFLAGVLVSFIELPCTGGVYLAILAMLSGSDVWAAAALLALYNSMFVLPLIAIIIAAAAGFSPEQLAVIRLEYRQYLRRAGGCVLILLGASVLLWFSV
jgi:cytochrome c biogenesis protein CcdA/thiol-disulfide isomerase/thioredoxin